MRATVVMLTLVGLGSCGGSAQPTYPAELWLGPGENEQNYVLTPTEPTPY